MTIIASCFMGLVILFCIVGGIYIHSIPVTHVQIGMSGNDFDRICKVDEEDRMFMISKTTETASGTTRTLKLPFEESRDRACDGTFTFIDDKLASITR